MMTVTEKRLIDANALWKVLDEAGLFVSGNPRHIAQQTVEEQPTVDAVEVVHGWWIKCESMVRSAQCSRCKGWFTKHSVYEPYPPYCPNCGAKMDGDKYE